jgi:hypothetical protein
LVGRGPQKWQRYFFGLFPLFSEISNLIYSKTLLAAPQARCASKSFLKMGVFKC